MGTREKYEPGTFSWVELITSDQDAAKKFYSSVFGWEYDDSEVPGGGGTYSMAQVDGTYAAAIYGRDDMPPNWNSYISVESVDDTVEKVGETDGEIVGEAFDVGDAGRMAILKDPSGALVSIWEAKDHIGAGVVNQHGALTWNDLQTRDVEAASKFYSEVFGWEIGDVEDAPDERRAIKVGDTLNGGMAKMSEEVPEEIPPHWLATFAVDDVDAALEAVKDGGGELVAGPLDVPSGKFAVVGDPQGAMFAIASGDLDE